MKNTYENAAILVKVASERREQELYDAYVAARHGALQAYRLEIIPDSDDESPAAAVRRAVVQYAEYVERDGDKYPVWKLPEHVVILVRAANAAGVFDHRIPGFHLAGFNPPEHMFSAYQEWREWNEFRKRQLTGEL